MSRRGRATFLDIDGKVLKIIGDTSGLPSDGEIRWCFGVVRGLKDRGAIDPATARLYFSTLENGSRTSCAMIVGSCKKLLEKSPSLRRGRERPRKPRRHGAPYHRDGQWINW